MSSNVKKASSAFSQVATNGGTDAADSTGTPTNSVSSSSASPDVGNAPLRIVSRSSSPNSQTTSTQHPKASTSSSSSSGQPNLPPPLHPHVQSTPSSQQQQAMLGSSNIIIHSQNPFPSFVSPQSQYGLFAQAIHAPGQPQTIILNHCGQPIFVSPASNKNFFPGHQATSSSLPQQHTTSNAASSSSAQTPSNNANGSHQSSTSRQPVLIPCKPAPPNVVNQHGVGIAPAPNMPIFPTQLFPSSAYPFPSFGNASLLLPTGQMLFRTPQGQLFGFSLPTNVGPAPANVQQQQQPVPLDPQTSSGGGGSKLQPVLPKPGIPTNIFSTSSSKSSSHPILNLPHFPQPPVAFPLSASNVAPALPATSSSNAVKMLVKDEPEAQAAASGNNCCETAENAANLRSSASAANLGGGLLTTTTQQHATPLMNANEVHASNEVNFRNDAAAVAEIHAMFAQEVENMVAAGERPQILTHFIDGFVIQESLEPFPLSPLIFDEFPMLIQPASTVDWSAPPRLTPEDRVTPEEEDMDVDGPTTPSPGRCLYCNFDLALKQFSQNPEFCKRSCLREYQKMRAESNERSPKKSKHGGEKRQKLDESSLEISSQSPTNFAVPSNTSSPKLSRETPSELPSTSLEEPSPPSLSDKSPSDWTVEDVQAWLFSLGSGVAQCTYIFRQQEIDGQALLLLQEDHLMRQMGLKLGPALKICAALKNLRN